MKLRKVNIVGRTATKTGRYWVCVTTLVNRDSATQAGIPSRMIVADALTAEGEAEVNRQHKASEGI